MIARFLTFLGVGLAVICGLALVTANWAGRNNGSLDAVTNPKGAALAAGMGLVGIGAGLIAGLISVAQDMEDK